MASSLLGILIVGAIAGWLAGLLTKGSGFGILMNIVFGVAGALLGGFIFGLIGFSAHGFIAFVIVGTIGAVILLFIINKIFG